MSRQLQAIDVGKEDGRDDQVGGLPVCLGLALRGRIADSYLEIGLTQHLGDEVRRDSIGVTNDRPRWMGALNSGQETSR